VCVCACRVSDGWRLTMVRTGPANYLSLLVHSARMEGFVLFDYIPEYPLGTRFAFAFVHFSLPPPPEGLGRDV